MIQQYFHSLSKYNQWANEKIITWCESLTDDHWNQELISSFPTIGDTVLHIVGAEQIWCDRLNDQHDTAWIPSIFKGNKSEVINVWRRSSSNLINYVENISSDRLSEKQYYRRLNGEEFSQPVFEILAHVFNHSTYHRGQLVTMLRQVGFTDVSSTDLLKYYTTR